MNHGLFPLIHAAEFGLSGIFGWIGLFAAQFFEGFLGDRIEPLAAVSSGDRTIFLRMAGAQKSER